MKKRFCKLILLFLSATVFAREKRSIKTDFSTGNSVDVSEFLGSVMPDFEKGMNSVDKTIAPRKKVRGSPLLNKKNVYDEIIPDANLFYRTMLSDEEKVTYDEIYNAVRDVTHSFPLKATVKSAELVKIVKSVFFDSPEFFYWDGGCSYFVNSDDRVTDVELKYLEEDHIQELYDDFWNMSSGILFYANLLETEIEKVKYIHDYICLSTDYDSESYHAGNIGGLLQTAYSAIVEYKTVCAGYSKAFAYYMQQLKIPCSCIYGNGHEWNIIKIDGNCFQIDVTWDDVSNDYPRYFSLNHSDMQHIQLHELTEECVSLVEKYPDSGKKDVYIKSFGYAPLGTPYVYSELKNIDEDFFHPENAKIYKDYSKILKYVDSLDSFIRVYYEFCAGMKENTVMETVIVKDRNLLSEIKKWLKSTDNREIKMLKNSASSKSDENIVLRLLLALS